jgi:hypothetical protein
VGRPITEETWDAEAVELMARTGMSLKAACTELEVEITNEAAAILLRRASFNRLLWQARHRYFRDLGSDPNFSKDTAIGKMINLSQKLEDEGELDKSAEVLFKIAKMTGWVGPESTVSVFGELSQKDLDAIRIKVKQGEIRPKLN